MDGYVQIGTKLDTKDFDAEIKYVESQLNEIEHKLKQADMGFEVGDTQKLEAQYSRLIKQLDRLQKKQADLNKTDLSKIERNIDKVGNSVSKTISKVGRWALAVFSVRSAYMFVRQAVSTLSQYNEQIASDLEYIRFATASMLQPVIEGLISLVYKLLTYVNFIAKAWFGVDLFANASAKAMEKGSKSAEKMKKSLAGFDEMNVLNDNGTTGAMGATPSFDLSQMTGEVPKWLVWLKDNGPTLLGIVGGIAAGIAAMKLSTLLQHLGLIPAALTAIQAIGIGVIIAGIIFLIQDIIDLIKDPTWQNFFNLLGDIAIIIGGIMLVMGNWWGLLIVIVGAVVKLVADNWDTVKEILLQVGTWVYNNVILPVFNFMKGLFDTIISIIKGAISVISAIFTTVFNIIANPFIVAKDTIVGIFNGIKTTIQGVFNVISGLFTGQWKKVMDGFKSIFKGTFDSLYSIAKAPLNMVIGAINSLIKGTNRIKFDVPDWVPGIGGKKWGFNIPTIPKLAVGGIVNMPGKGVPIGGALTGEVSKEGVIPLTNAQAMEELGATIGRYITVNANITNTMNGRVISRELHKINANNDFATNN